MAEHRRIHESYIYIAECPTDPTILKIGYSAHPEVRIKQQRCPDGSKPAIRRLFKKDGPCLFLEQKAHKNVAEHRVKNEWFRISEQTAIWAVMRAERDLWQPSNRTRRKKQVGPLEILCDWRPNTSPYTLAKQYGVEDLRFAAAKRGKR